MNKLTILNIEQYCRAGARYLVLMTQKDGTTIVVSNYRMADTACKYVQIVEGIMAKRRDELELPPPDMDEMPF